MAGRFAASWALTKQCFRVLRQDKRLMLFPVMSFFASMVALAIISIPAVPAIIAIINSAEKNPGAVRQDLRIIGPVVGAIIGFVSYTITVFFNAALIAAVNDRFEGRPGRVSDGLRAAFRRLPQILGWCLFAATVGLILRMISERLGILGRLVIWIVGVAWSIAIFFVVPALVLDGLGPISALKRSVETVRKAWGESLIINVGLGLAGFALTFLAILPVAIGGVVTVLNLPPSGNPGIAAFVPVGIGLLVTVVLCICLGIVASSLKTIAVAALYRFGAAGMVPEGFSHEALRGAIRPKKAQKNPTPPAAPPLGG